MMRNHKQPISEVNLTAPDQINNVRALEDKREYFDELPIDLVEDVDQVYGKVSLRVQALVFDNSQTILQGVVPDHQTSRSTENILVLLVRLSPSESLSLSRTCVSNQAATETSGSIIGSSAALCVTKKTMSSGEERNRPGNSMAGLSNLQMRAFSNSPGGRRLFKKV
ncbi:hypothetical protein F2Q70_00042968 [Brassica cretica]|uniref:Uncharacterized protein n=1 Tax=Brassica cretica TaxID=69181 RepID=A0A8S9KGU7_BRACR|nr:hypothetical protein F2Q70_00042968 [Brassica cretica]